MTSHSRKITLDGHDYLVIDLTLPLSMDQEGYPGDPQPARSVFSDISRDGWQHYSHEIGDHCFHPHCDAPSHFQTDQQGRGMEIYDLSWSFHRACLINLTNTREVKDHNGIRFLPEVKKIHLEPFLETLRKNEAVIIHTGYDRWVEKNHPHLPGLMPYLTSEAAEFIGSLTNINVVGIDSLTVDPFGLQVSHLALKNKMIVESLVHLDEIPEDERDCFSLQTTPLRIVGATGGPVIAYAYIAL